MRNEIARAAGSALVLLSGAIALGACESRSVAVEAEVYRIDRTCQFVTKQGNGDGHSADCSSTGEFARLRRNPKGRTMNIVGEAKIEVSYASPVDRSAQTGTLELSGRDDEFYTLKADDKIMILVDKTDPSRIRKL